MNEQQAIDALAERVQAEFVDDDPHRTGGVDEKPYHLLFVDPTNPDLPCGIGWTCGEPIVALMVDEEEDEPKPICQNHKDWIVRQGQWWLDDRPTKEDIAVCWVDEQPLLVVKILEAS